MYNLKKVIASICVIAMLLTTVAFGATYSDVAEDSAYYEAVETLNKLEIVTGYEDGTYKPEAGVTRAEMAALIARIQGYGDTAAGSANTTFTDVPASHWASGYVANAAGMGIINGYGDGTFGPEDPVLYEQAVKMIMATLGYTPYAENNGGYPGGYLAAAQRYDVANGVSNATMGTEANRGTIAQLLVNAIDTPLMAQKTWATDGTAEYVIYDGEDYALRTLMSVNLGYVKIRGVVEETAYTNIYAGKSIDTSDDAIVKVDVTDAFDTANKDFAFDEDGNYDGVDTFLAGTTDVEEFIGKSVLAYVKKLDNNDYEIVSITADTARNDVLSIDLSQFNKINTQGKFEYYKTADAKTATAVTIEEDVVVFNNAGGYDMDDIFGVEVDEGGATLNGGKITLIDNDTTNGYDVIFVEIAETAVVAEAEEGYVAFKKETSVTGLMDLVIDEDDENVVISITKDGEAVAAADLVEWDVLSIIANGDESYIKAEVISNAVIGTIKSVAKSDTSATGFAYTVEGAKYDVADGAYGQEDLDIGEGGTFYIDKYGKIAAFNEDAALASGVSANYAYVTAAAIDTDVLTGENTAIVQMVTKEGVVALNIKSTNAEVNGSTFDADDYTSGQLETLLKNKVVSYTKDSSDKIKSITTADADAEITTEIASDTSLAYDAENGRFETRKYVDADAIVFFIDASEATDSYVGAVADLEDDVTYTVKGLYADDKAEDNNILVVAVASAISPKTNMGVLTAIGTSANDEGEEIYSVEVLVNGETIVADTTADVYPVENLTVGDIVKVKVGSDGLVSALDIVYNFAEGVRSFANPFAGVTATEAAAGPNEEYVGGKVVDYKKSSSSATVEDVVGEGTEDVEIKLSQAQNVIVIDANGRDVEIKKSSASNFKAYDALYDTTLSTVNVTIDKVDKGEKALAEAQKAADYVYARQYDGKVVDLVIVKGVADMRVTAGALAEEEEEEEEETPAVTAAAALTDEAFGKDLTTLGTGIEFAIADDTITVTGTLNNITGWDAFSTIDGENAGYYVPASFTVPEGADVSLANGEKPVKNWENVTGGTFDIVIRLEVDGDVIDDAILTVDGQEYTIVFDVDFAA